MNPLHRLPSIKLKFGVVIVAAIGVAAFLSQYGYRSGWPVWPRPIIAGAISLVMVHFLAKGMTRPLREMEAAASQMAKGDYRHRIETQSVDEVGRLSDAFNAMSAELAKIEQERRDLVMNVSHELRTPLTALRAQLENMIDGVTEPTPEQLDVSLAQSLRLEALISRLMDLARLESGQVALQRTQVDTRSMLETAVAEASMRAPGVSFVVDCCTGPNSGDLKIDADEQLLLQVFANLLDNAGRHDANGTVTIEARRAPDHDKTRIEIRDTGPGLSADDADRVFERFYRADSARSKGGGGAGLGLSIARGIVDLHGGTIRAEPNQPRGLRVIVEI